MARPETKKRDDQSREPGRATRRPIATARANPLWSQLALDGGALRSVNTARPNLVVRRKCACGAGASSVSGECEECSQKKLGAQANLRVNAPGDVYEQEADRVAEQVLAPHSFSPRRGLPPISHPVVQRACSCGGTCPRCQAASHLATDDARGGLAADPAGVYRGLNSAGHPLTPDTRAFFEARLGHDLSGVRVHTDADAADSAHGVNALAYTIGRDVVFGRGQYAPETGSGQRLLAHELVHVVQQSAPGGPPAGQVQRAPTLDILDEGFVGPPSTSQRRAARSCPITCCLSPIGTLHAMPLFHHASRGAQVAAGDASATGIGAALHFIAGGSQPAAGDLCHCDDFRIIQVLETNNPAPGRGGNSYVDNSGTATPFYSDVFLGGRGEHPIPAGYPDAGQRLTTTESIYDRPFRDPATLGVTSLSWRAEACVACIKNGAPDLVLGCATYGFDRPYNATTHAFDPVIGIGPDCGSRPTDHFVKTLQSDPTTNTYDFKPAPSLTECFPTGDFPTPPEDTRLA